MAVNLRVRRALFAAERIIRSTESGELAEILLLCILGMLASVVLLAPGDQTLDGMRHIIACVFD
ncbi:MAG: hypothetical protein ACREFL_11475 [Stellaceae bacterium]